MPFLDDKRRKLPEIEASTEKCLIYNRSIKHIEKKQEAQQVQKVKPFS